MLGLASLDPTIVIEARDDQLHSTEEEGKCVRQQLYLYHKVTSHGLSCRVHGSILKVWEHGAEKVRFWEDLWKESEDTGRWVWVFCSHCSPSEPSPMARSQVNALQFSR